MMLGCQTMRVIVRQPPALSPSVFWPGCVSVNWLNAKLEYANSNAALTYTSPDTSICIWGIQETGTRSGRGRKTEGVCWDVIYVRCKVFHNFFLHFVASLIIFCTFLSLFGCNERKCKRWRWQWEEGDGCTAPERDRKTVREARQERVQKIRLICLKKSQAHENFH